MESRLPSASSGSSMCSPHKIDSAASVTMPRETWTIHVCPTTGGNFDLTISSNDTVDGLKKAIGKKLRIPKERISLLFKERLLKEGFLKDSGIFDQCKITLLPNVEAGLAPQKPEHSVLQALENLSDSQVNDFLTGKSPLTLAMRLGEHMMVVQLQLSTSPPHHQARGGVTPQRAAYPTRCPSHQPSSPTPASIPTPHKPSLPGQMLQHPRACPPRQSPPKEPVPRAPVPPAPSSSSPPPSPTDPRTFLDSNTLAEAKRSLSQKLKEFSQQASTSSQKSKENTDTSKRSSGAIIESMHHLGQGVYSGTFSGTLNPTLQDEDGKPRRSINTIIHILNDLLGASPQYRAHVRACSRNIRCDRSAKAPLQTTTNHGSTVSREEDRAIRGKVEHIQMMLAERRQKRKARRDAKHAPYPTAKWGNLPTGMPSAGLPTPPDSPMEVEGDCAQGSAFPELRAEDTDIKQGAVVA